MDYRAPEAGLERRLGDLEEELARLRALPPRKRKGPPRVSKKERALEKRLASLDEQLAKAGVRELTERETGTLQRMARMGVVLILCGLAVASLHLVLRGGEAMTWTATTCTIVAEDEAVFVARYVSHGEQWEFSASGGSRSGVACWVPEPPHSGMGRLARPTSLRISLREKLSSAWLIASASSVFLGLLCVLAAASEAQKRRKGIIAADVFPSSD